jgi:phage terminase small subunit
MKHGPKKATDKHVRETENLSPPTPRIDRLPAEPDEGPWDKETLTTRQRLFVDALVGPAGGNATKAALMAGYRESSAAESASENLRKSNVQNALALAFAKKTQSDPEWLKDSLFDLARASMTNFIEVGEDGSTRFDFKKARDAGALGQIAELTQDAIGEHVIRTKVKLHDRVKALGVLAKILGLIVDKTEVSGPNGAPIKTETTHHFDHDKYRSLFSGHYGKRIAGNVGGTATPNSN